MILVVGQAGTGKSTILEELTGLDLTVAGSLKSGNDCTPLWWKDQLEIKYSRMIRHSYIPSLPSHH